MPQAWCTVCKTLKSVLREWNSLLWRLRHCQLYIQLIILFTEGEVTDRSRSSKSQEDGAVETSEGVFRNMNCIMLISIFIPNILNTPILLCVTIQCTGNCLSWSNIPWLTNLTSFGQWCIHILALPDSTCHIVRRQKGVVRRWYHWCTYLLQYSWRHWETLLTSQMCHCKEAPLYFKN
jgi:hypothetical protein